MSDDEIDTSDIPPITPEQFARATIRLPGEPRRPQVTVSVEVGPDVAEWYAAQGEDRDRRLRAALRLYATAHRD